MSWLKILSACRSRLRPIATGPVLSRDDLLDFAKDEAALAKMRKTGWELDQDKFPPDQNYPVLNDGPYGPTEDVMAV
ncbi:hypothetical protein PI124_g13558 [Phytophthora idaei]|nr:hypothetical protein PI126_g13581 [Phytophthora idaei]KAG3241590.1 hypothetical protein PI124_g13558 [Phytophthora idaei]